MQFDDSIYVKNFCLGCKKLYCNGNCVELKQYIKDLIDKNVLPKYGRPKKTDKKDI